MGQQVCGVHQVAPPEVRLSHWPPVELEKVEQLLLLHDTRRRDASEPRRCRAREGPDGDSKTKFADAYLSTSSLGAHYEFQTRTAQDRPGVRFLRHKATGEVRRMVSVKKPRDRGCQQKLRGTIQVLNSLKSPGVARVVDVFEDARAFHLVSEGSTLGGGGSLFDRILKHECFSEQECALLVKHLLQAVEVLHNADLAHGFLHPECFRFDSDRAHAPLKLVDYGLELKVSLWDRQASAASGRPPDRRLSHSPLREACCLVFCPPEILSTTKVTDTQHDSSHQEDFNDQLEELKMSDLWGLGAIAFLLLCGYPPFFAPTERAILSRIMCMDLSFDPPFWSKISEEAKDFVQHCLRQRPRRRITLEEAFRHPWVQKLAETSPSGAMLNSFSVNLRRFYRTVLIESVASSILAANLSIGQIRQLLNRCLVVDCHKSGFVTSSDLREALVTLGHVDLSEAIMSGLTNLKLLRHSGESYLDYTALTDATMIRKELLFEEEMWDASLEFAKMALPTNQAQSADLAASGRLSQPSLRAFLEGTSDVASANSSSNNNSNRCTVPALLLDYGVPEGEINEHAAKIAAAVRLQSAGDCSGGGGEVDFVDLAAAIVGLLPKASLDGPTYPTAAASQATAPNARNNSNANISSNGSSNSSQPQNPRVPASSQFSSVSKPLNDVNGGGVSSPLL